MKDNRLIFTLTGSLDFQSEAVFSLPEGQLHCAEGTLHWRSHFICRRQLHLRQSRNFIDAKHHFICRKATSFVYVRFSDNEVDSKLSNEVLASLVTKLCPADINEKSKSEDLDFWLGRRDSNPRMQQSKCCVLPLDDSPKCYFIKKIAKSTDFAIYNWGG